ncbi:hypothetical protein GBA63_05860 [Rubrobacter tropicus]|uniref:Uncharacterized protein n=1 Tax=Rubrobacter tropicus TaxID=2653851 RepID=A0A6G8Q6W0_9ACTN|nr:hypothetical protein [Rubrobacter tropicus]QIN82224.1 hypothetical protein GBA63_05860 [Rubrobacter tropicus]
METRTWPGAPSAASADPPGGARDADTSPGPAVYGAAALSLVSALVYLWAAPMQFVLWWGYSLFFLAFALFQGIYAVALLRWPTQPLCLLGIWPNLALFLLYLVWYTRGIPFGPHAGMLMYPQRVDVAGALAEVGIVVALVTLLRGAPRRAAVNTLCLIGAAIWAAVLAGMIS